MSQLIKCVSCPLNTTKQHRSKSDVSGSSLSFIFVFSYKNKHLQLKSQPDINYNSKHNVSILNTLLS